MGAERQTGRLAKKKAKRPARHTPTVVVGWNEFIDLPAWGVAGLHAKIDTGARSSSLHVEDFEILPDNEVSFSVPLGLPSHRWQRVTAGITRTSHVRSSNGQRSLRYFVTTTLALGGIQTEIELNLVDRGDMRFPMLIGRTALAHHYIVDPGRRCLASERPKKVPKVPPHKVRKKDR